MLFRRTKSPDTPTDPSAAAITDASSEPRANGKGRPTPKRKEAEAAARARARGPRTKREARQQQRQARAEATKITREGMKKGDERYLLPRDKGPVRRFVRDFVDSRFTFAELSMPLVLVIWVMGITGVPGLVDISGTLMLAFILALILDLVLLRFRLRRELTQRFPDDSHKGCTFYAITRALQLRLLRLPKPQVRIGTSLVGRRYR